MPRSRALTDLLLSFAVAGRALAAAPDEDVAGELRRAEEKACQSLATGSLADWSALSTEDVEIDSPGELPARGRDAAVERLSRHGCTERDRGATTHFDVGGDRAVETGFGPASEGGAISSIRVVFWQRQSDGSWRIRREIFAGDASVASRIRPGASESSVAPAAPGRGVSAPEPAASASFPAEEVIPIPDPRSLSDGFVRTTAEQLHARASRIRAAEASGAADARRAAVERADRELRKLVRDIGWIDVDRFGTAASCDAAFIVAASGDAPLIRAAVPLMKDLESNPESAGCQRAAREAFQGLPPR